MARRRSSPRAAAPTAPADLAEHPSAARLQALLRERARLLREVQKKQEQLQRWKHKVKGDAESIAIEVAPILARQDSVVAELTSLFDELLTAGRLGNRARKQVVRLRRLFELEGLLVPLRDAEDPELEGDDEAWPERSERQGAGGTGAARPADGAGRVELSSAPQPPPERRSLRDLFRNLARAIHPDRARLEVERARRTELMKEVTRAYEEGDLARLIELENAWLDEPQPLAAADSEGRCRELERINRELLDQLRKTTRELRDLKHEVRDELGGLAPAELVAQATAELEQRLAIAELVRRFRDGKITLEDLLRGPSRPRRRHNAS